MDSIISCSNNHEQILYSHNGYAECPLCALTEHNNEVHDFIEKNNYTNKLVQFLKDVAIKKGQERSF